MCEHLGEYNRGYRSFGDDIPGCCQGAYYPGDEPGYRCELSGEPCNPEQCPLTDQEHEKEPTQ